jgi:hypothetical protein
MRRRRWREGRRLGRRAEAARRGAVLEEEAGLALPGGVGRGEGGGVERERVVARVRRRAVLRGARAREWVARAGHDDGAERGEGGGDLEAADVGAGERLEAARCECFEVRVRVAVVHRGGGVGRGRRSWLEGGGSASFTTHTRSPTPSRPLHPPRPIIKRCIFKGFQEYHYGCGLILVVIRASVPQHTESHTDTALCWRGRPFIAPDVGRQARRGRRALRDLDHDRASLPDRRGGRAPLRDAQAQVAPMPWSRAGASARLPTRRASRARHPVLTLRSGPPRSQEELSVERSQGNDDDAAWGRSFFASPWQSRGHLQAPPPAIPHGGGGFDPHGHAREFDQMFRHMEAMVGSIFGGGFDFPRPAPGWHQPPLQQTPPQQRRPPFPSETRPPPNEPPMRMHEV